MTTLSEVRDLLAAADDADELYDANEQLHVLLPDIAETLDKAALFINDTTGGNGVHAPHIIDRLVELLEKLGYDMTDARELTLTGWPVETYRGGQS